MNKLSAEYGLDFHRDSSPTLQIRLSGKWKIGNDLPSEERVSQELDNFSGIREISFDTSDLIQWDSGLLVFLVEVNRLAEKRDIKVYKDNLGDGIRRLLELASAVPEQADVGKSKKPSFWIATIGSRVDEMARDSLKVFEFIGNVFLSFSRLFMER